MEYGNWLGILKWSLAQTDGTAPSEARPMSEDDKKWLEQVMKETVKDEPMRMNEIMKEFVQMLEDGLTEEKSDTILDLLDELRSIVEQVDMAQVFVKFGGFQCLLGLLDSEIISFEARSLAASTIATLTQNHLEAQEKALKDGILDRLAKVFIQSKSPNLCNKVLYALSCSVRNHPAAEEYFLLNLADRILPKAISGLNDLSALAETPAAEALVSRALFFSHALVVSDYSSTTRVHKLKALLLPLSERALESESGDLKEMAENLLTALRDSPHAHGSGVSMAVVAK